MRASGPLGTDHFAARCLQCGALDREILIEGRYPGIAVYSGMSNANVSLGYRPCSAAVLYLIVHANKTGFSVLPDGSLGYTPSVLEQCSTPKPRLDAPGGFPSRLPAATMCQDRPPTQSIEWLKPTHCGPSFPSTFDDGPCPACVIREHTVERRGPGAFGSFPICATVAHRYQEADDVGDSQGRQRATVPSAESSRRGSSALVPGYAKKQRAEKTAIEQGRGQRIVKTC